MNELRLTRAQLKELRRKPLNGARNKIRVALKILDKPQSALVAALDVSKAQVSDLVNSKYNDLYLEATARKVSDLFGACIEDIFPPACAAGRKRAA